MAGDHTYISNINIVIVDVDYFFFFCCWTITLFVSISVALRFFMWSFAVGAKTEPVHQRHGLMFGCRNSRWTSCLQTKQRCVVVVVFGRPGSRLVHSDLESEPSAVDVLPPNSLLISGRGLYCRLFLGVLHLKDKAGIILYFPYCEQIPWKDQNQQCVCSSRITSPPCLSQH